MSTVPEAQAPAATSMLAVQDLTVAYGPVTALDGVRLSVAEGAITAVLGANGAGKSSLLRTINGLVRPKAGTVSLAGKDITRVPVEDVVRRGLAHVPEGRGVIVELTVDENLRLGGLARRNGGDHATAADRVYTLFPPLAQRRRRLAQTLSGGERQMLAIGRALMSHPRVLLLDEPSLGLAPRLTAEIMAVVSGLRESENLTVLLVEQNARSALSIADRAVVLNVGRVVVDAPAADLAADATLRHAYLGF
jgi:branched-chain amino acid transport system ATP-binding protein